MSQNLLPRSISRISTLVLLTIFLLAASTSAQVDTAWIKNLGRWEGGMTAEEEE